MTALPSQPQSFEAVIFCPDESSSLPIAGLTVLDRLIVTIHRAGANSICVVARGNLPPTPRTVALGIKVQIASEAPRHAGMTLVAIANLLVQVPDVLSIVHQQARLTTADGVPLPIGMLAGLTSDWQHRFNQEPAPAILTEGRDASAGLAAKGVALPVTNPHQARVAEAALWASLGSSADGLVDRYFNRPCGRLLSKLLVHTCVSPNAVSIGSILIGVLAAWLFADGGYRAAVWGALLFQLSAIVDCVDGDLARILFKESPLGKWLDLAGDQVVHLSVFAGIAVGAARAGSQWAGWLGVNAMLGALISFAVVVRGMRAPAGNNHRLQKLIDAMTNRDFSVLVLALALFDRLEWFLWMSAIGSHVFWMTAIALQLTAAPREHSRS